ncbi:adenosylcobinamide-phosphate synthase CbiB [Shimia ponticola]|uniref:adenosylcobinamide-phosphate synthase CbiB n=1 Tax=Shimia ponticola TaxID=2582893 RepID=UPI0011BE87CD|nr:adenosylcobinamide-phosphate synthase CbiB [Shimia ponticola]
MTLAFAMILDAIFGEPKWLYNRVPHPAVLMGRAIGWADKRFNSGSGRRAKGAFVMAALIVAAAALGLAIAELGNVVTAIVAATLLAQRSLVDHVARVADALRLSTQAGRSEVAMIVGRDTAGMDDPAIARAAIESAAENFSDGVLAPIFWFALAGLPGLLVYKITNTADSMIGYRTPRHEAFGWAAARFDDVLNWVPARLSAIAFAVWTPALNVQELLADARLHRSPNAGWPEAAMAQSLDVALSGPRSYEGEMRNFPFVHPTGRRDAGPAEIDAACQRLWNAWTVTLITVLLGSGIATLI